MIFNVEVELPSGKKCRVRELTNREYLTLIKFAQNKDFIGLTAFFEDIYIEPHLHIFDRLYLLIYVRMIYIDSSITLNLDSKDIDISLDTLLAKLEANYVDLEKKFKENNIEITLDIPCLTYYDQIEDLYISTIKCIKLQDNVVEFNTLSKIDQQEIINHLPASIFNIIKNYIIDIQDNLLQVNLIEENQTLGVQSLDVNILNNGVMQFINSLYSTDLKGFYTLIYIFQNTILPGSNYFFEMSPIETQIIVNAHKKRVSEENKKLQNQNQG